MVSVPANDRAASPATQADDLPWLAHLLDSETRHELAEDDRSALKNVSAILLAVVVMGLVLGGIGVVFAVQR